MTREIYGVATRRETRINNNTNYLELYRKFEKEVEEVLSKANTRPKSALRDLSAVLGKVQRFGHDFLGEASEKIRERYKEKLVRLENRIGLKKDDLSLRTGFIK